MKKWKGNKNTLGGRNMRKKLVSLVLAGALLFSQSGLTVQAAEPEEAGTVAAQDQSITASVNPTQIGEAGGEVTLTLAGTGMRADGWEASVKTYIAETEIERPQYSATVKDKKGTTATLVIPANGMKNALEYHILVTKKDGSEIQRLKVTQDGKAAQSVSLQPLGVAMTDDTTVVVTFAQDVAVAGEAEKIKSLMYLASNGDESVNRRNLGEADTVTAEGKTVTIKLAQQYEAKVDTALYVKEGALKTADGKRLKGFKWAVIARPHVDDIQVTPGILSAEGGQVVATLKGVRLDTLPKDRIQAKLIRGTATSPAEIPIEVTPGIEPTLTYTLPANDTENTISYLLKVEVDKVPVYEQTVENPAKAAVVSVLPKGKTAADQTLSHMRIGVISGAEEGATSTHAVVTVRSALGQLKVQLKLSGTNLDDTKTKVRAVDENGIVWPIIHVPE